MSSEKLSTETVLDDENQANKDSKKRVSYIAKDLATIIEFVGKVYNSLGHTSYHSNKAIATIHGLSPDSIKQYLTAAQGYKLFELKHGTGYKITEHFQKIFLPKNDNEKRSAVIESLKNPETYQQLFKDYEYHLVPLEGVKNHFIRSYGFKEDVALKATQVFLQNLKDFELLDGRGVLTSALPSKPIVPKISKGEEVETSEGNPEPNKQEQETRTGSEVAPRPRVEKLIFQSELDASDKKTIPIYLTDSKQAVFLYPDNITEDDIELVKHQIEGVLLRIKLDTRSKTAKD